MEDKHRGYYTGWLQTSPTLGIVLSLIVIIATRTYVGEAAFNAWAWRIPFLFSFLLVFIAFYIRSQFEESPIYAEIKAKGETSTNPWREAFLNPANLKYVVIANFSPAGSATRRYPCRITSATAGRRFGAFHNHGGVSGDRQCGLRADLPDRRSRGVFGA